MRAFATIHPAEVAGLVLIDSTHERQWLEWDKLLGLPAGENVAAAIADSKAKKDEITAREMEGLGDVWASGKLGLSDSLPDVPMAVITSLRPVPGQPPAARKLWRSLHDEIFAATTHGMNIVTNKSGHNISGEETDSVVDAIRWVVEAVRAEKFGGLPKGSSAKSGE